MRKGHPETHDREGYRSNVRTQVRDYGVRAQQPLVMTFGVFCFLNRKGAPPGRLLESLISTLWGTPKKTRSAVTYHTYVFVVVKFCLCATAPTLYLQAGIREGIYCVF